MTQYPASLDSSFAARGPGARSGLSWLRGCPPAFCKDAQGHQTDLFFSDQLDSLGAHFLRNSFLKYNPSDSAPIRSVKHDLRRHLSTLEGRGYYALCKFSKVVSDQLGVAQRKMADHPLVNILDPKPYAYLSGSCSATCCPAWGNGCLLGGPWDFVITSAIIFLLIIALEAHLGGV